MCVVYVKKEKESVLSLSPVFFWKIIQNMKNQVCRFQVHLLTSPSRIFRWKQTNNNQVKCYILQPSMQKSVFTRRVLYWPWLCLTMIGCAEHTSVLKIVVHFTFCLLFCSSFSRENRESFLYFSLFQHYFTF